MGTDGGSGRVLTVTGVPEVGAWEAPVLLNQTWVHTPELNKAGLLAARLW